MSAYEESLFQDLAFDDVRRLIADYAHSEPVKSALLALGSVPDLANLERMHGRVGELLDARREDRSWNLREFADLQDHLDLLKLRDSTLPSTWHRDILAVLQLSRELLGWMRSQLPRDGSNWREVEERFESMTSHEHAIERVVGPDGEVLDQASPELGRIRHEIEKAGRGVRSGMQKLIQRYSAEGWLNEDRPSLRGGRLVLPVLSSYKKQVKGVIQDQSHTGQTTFIEPYEIIELNNQIKSLQMEEMREVERILRELTATLHPHHGQIQGNYQALLEFDRHAALADFGFRFDAVVPQVSTDLGLCLKAARNPRLMLQREVVPLDMESRPGTRTLIITGPNAGGKTVALKTLGLLALMANSGIPVPAAEGTSIPHYDQIFTDIGDQQSLVNDLSTFSAHMHSLIRILQGATTNSLVLLDELGTGTDPAEGAALSRVILENLQETGCMTVATTHLGDLKTFAHESEGVLNGAMEFDQTALQPTYRFLAGIPGSSYGFEIAQRLGLRGTLLEKARGYLGASRTSLEELLQDLEAERQETRALRETTEQLERELLRKQKQLDRSLASVRKSEKHAERDAARQAREIVRETRQTMERLIREIREQQASRDSIRTARSELEDLNARIERMAEDAPDPETQPPLPVENIHPDARVRLRPLAQQGTVVGHPSGGKVFVDVEGKRLKVPVGWLSAAPADGSPGKPGDISVHVNRSESPGYTLDLRGDRYEEARQRLQAFLDRALLANLAEVRIIHGKGTGVLQKLVTDVLKTHKAIREFSLGGLDEGGAGITIAKF